MKGVDLRERCFYLETFGCQMNEQDSLRMCDQLSKAGYQRTHEYANADLIIVNSCSIRKKAEEKVYSLLGRFRPLKIDNSRTIVALGGCVAQQEGSRLEERFPFIDIIFGPHHVGHIEELVEKFRVSRTPLVEVSQEANSECFECDGIPGQEGVKAYVTIMEGCDNFCSYCIVPHVRGRERSRSHHSIEKEVESLIGRGVKELTLLGQNVNSYSDGRASEGFGFPELLERLNGIEGLRRLRFTTSHPKDLSERLIGCYGRLACLCEHMHLPLQSGSNKILSAMNRGYTVEQYMKKVEQLRKCSPEIAITSDIIIGFPGEADKDFRATLQALREIHFDTVFSFKYSPRPGTQAALMEETLSEEEKSQRLGEFQECQRMVTLNKNQEIVGRQVEVLVEGVSREGHQLLGRTRTNKIVNFPGPESLVGEFCEVKVLKGCKNSLIGLCC